MYNVVIANSMGAESIYFIVDAKQSQEPPSITMHDSFESGGTVEITGTAPGAAAEKRSCYNCIMYKRGSLYWVNHDTNVGCSGRHSICIFAYCHRTSVNYQVRNSPCTTCNVIESCLIISKKFNTIVLVLDIQVHQTLHLRKFLKGLSIC